MESFVTSELDTIKERQCVEETQTVASPGLFFFKMSAFIGLDP